MYPSSPARPQPATPLKSTPRSTGRSSSRCRAVSASAFGERWFGEFTLSADQHFAAWESEDRVSGAQGRSGDYFAYGFHLGIGYRFE